MLNILVNHDTIKKMNTVIQHEHIQLIKHNLGKMYHSLHTNNK